MELTDEDKYGAWGGREVRDFLQRARVPLRLAIATARGPLIVPLWYHFESDRFICCSPSRSVLVETLNREPLVGFDVSTNEIPYRGIRGRARAYCNPADGEAVLRRLLERYTGGCDSDLAQWLLSRAADEAVIEVTPEWLTSWDFSARMRDLVRPGDATGS